MKKISIGLIIMAIAYIVAGINHFINHKSYLRMMPSYIPGHPLMVKFSGLAEIILGIALLFPATRIWAAWGIILLLIAIFPANLYMFTSGRFSRIPEWLLLVRLPLQLVLIWWAYQYTKI